MFRGESGLPHRFPNAEVKQKYITTVYRILSDMSIKISEVLLTMENKLQIFNSDEFGTIRTVNENGKTLFCGFDVANALGYIRPSDAVKQHCRATVKRSTPISGKMQEINFISEGDVYRLIIRSKLPSADKFERWIFDDILPTIQRHGAYITSETLERVMNDPDTWITLITSLKAERTAKEKLQLEAEINKPKVIFADAVSVSDDTISVGQLAKHIKAKGFDIGQNRLFGWLREHEFLIKRQSSDYNLPTQTSMDAGLFEIMETAVTQPDGTVNVYKTTKVTGKGQQYFINKFIAEVH